MSYHQRLIVLCIVSLLAIVVMYSFSPIAQDLAYHQFADNRALWGIANMGDVASNFLFSVFGLMGLLALYRRDNLVFTMPGEALLWGIFFIGATLVGAGSSYYHLAPDNHTLVWDRLPMTIAFMSLFALILMERLHPRTGLCLAPFLLIIGAGSVFYWDHTESIGQGDLRLYALVQFLPIMLIPLLLRLFPARYTGLKYLGYTLGWYVLAKILEHYDVAVFHVLFETVSGHTLKHLAAAMSVYSLLLYLKKRRQLTV